MKKPYSTVKATVRQRKAVINLVENRGNVSKAMRDAGYPETTCKNPANLTDSKGFQGLMNELGLTDDFLVQALKEDIGLKKANRKPELELAFKLKGKLKDSIDVTSGGEIIKSIEYVVPKEGSTKP